MTLAKVKNLVLLAIALNGAVSYASGMKMTAEDGTTASPKISDTMPCSDWLDQDTQTQKTWLMGFLTGVNYVYVMGNLTSLNPISAMNSLDSEHSRMMALCLENPKDRAYHAGMKVFIEIHDRAYQRRKNK